MAITAGIGSDHVDLSAAMKHGITVAEVTKRHGKAPARKPARKAQRRPSPATRAAKPSTKPRQGKAASAAKTKPPAGARPGTKQAALIAMLERPQGATIEEIVAKTGWQPHTCQSASKRDPGSACKRDPCWLLRRRPEAMRGAVAERSALPEGAW